MSVQKEVKLCTEKVSDTHSCDWTAHDTDDADVINDWIVQMVSYCQVSQWTDRNNAQLSCILSSTLDDEIRGTFIPHYKIFS